MKYLFTVSLLFSLFYYSAFSQSSVWRVVKDSSVIYIGGTMHLLKDKDYPLPVAYDSAFAHADILVFETDIEESENASNALAMMKKFQFKDGNTLEKVLEPSVYKDLEIECAKYGITLATLSTYKPILSLLTLSVMQMQKEGFTAEGVDKYYFTKAKKAEKQILFFETNDQQIDFLLSLCEENENEFVKYYLKDLNSLSDELEAMRASWRDGSGTEIVKQEIDMIQNYPTIHKILLLNRNNDWLQKITPYFSSPEIEFILVGAAHLYGENSLLKLLELNGCNLEQL